MKLQCASRTDVGETRKANQDSLVVRTGAATDGRFDLLAVVADGMGGRAGGETASRITVETLPEVVCEVLLESAPEPDDTDLADALHQAISICNDAVNREARQQPELRGMGTTCVAALIRGTAAAICNVGDSRAYLLSTGTFRQVTSDHSLVQEYVRAGDLTNEQARSSRFRNVITRAIGAASTVEPDIEIIDLADGDSLLLCSDGLTTMLPDEEIARTLATVADAQQACDRLVASANRAGGYDNISVVIVRTGNFVPAAAPVLVESRDTPPEMANGAGRAPETDGYRPGVSRAAEGIAGASTGWRALALFFALAIAILGAGLYYTGVRGFRLSGRLPFLIAPVTVAAPPRQAPANLAELQYYAPKSITSKPFRNSPLVADSAGSLYALTESGRIVRVSPDGSLSGDFGAPLRRSSESGERAERHWAADPQGNLYVSSRTGKAIYKYNPGGTRIAIIGADELESPGAIAVDARGNLYVVDAGRLKVLRAHPARAGGAGPVAQPERPHGEARAPGGLSVEERHAPR